MSGFEPTKMIEVCGACFRASCWQGDLYCDEYKGATVVRKHRDELQRLSLEHPSYWEICDEHGLSYRVCGCEGPRERDLPRSQRTWRTENELLQDGDLPLDPFEGTVPFDEVKRGAL